MSDNIVWRAPFWRRVWLRITGRARHYRMGDE